MERRYLTDRISYLPAGSRPLSADVGIIEGERFIYLFDVGADGTVAEVLNALPKEKKVILSHFHPDHIGNIERITYTGGYLGANTAGYLGSSIEKKERKPESEASLRLQGWNVVTAPVTVSDGVQLTIFPIPSSHAKGSLALEVDESYTFLGDALYCTTKKGRDVYNAQLLKEQIDFLKTLRSDFLLLSHAEPFRREKAEVIGELEEIYGRRSKSEPYIEVEGKL